MVECFDIPALLGNVGDRVGAVQEQLVERIRVVGSAREPATDADDRNRIGFFCKTSLSHLSRLRA
jgi:hypothetical protein